MSHDLVILDDIHSGWHPFRMTFRMTFLISDIQDLKEEIQKGLDFCIEKNIYVFETLLN